MSGVLGPTKIRRNGKSQEGEIVWSPVAKIIFGAVPALLVASVIALVQLNLTVAVNATRLETLGDQFDKHIQWAERNQSAFVPRIEVERMHQQIQAQIDRLNRDIDHLEKFHPPAGKGR